MLCFGATTARDIRPKGFGVGPPGQVRDWSTCTVRGALGNQVHSASGRQLQPSSSCVKISVFTAGGQEVTCLRWNKRDSDGGRNIPHPQGGSSAVEQGPRVLVWPPGLASWLMLCSAGLENSWEPFYLELLYYPKQHLKLEVILIIYFLSPSHYSLLFWTEGCLD